MITEVMSEPPAQFSFLNFWYENHVTISLVLLVIAVIILMIKVYDLLVIMQRKSRTHRNTEVLSNKAYEILGSRVIHSRIDQEKYYMWSEAIYKELFQIHKVLIEIKEQLTTKEEK